MKTKQQPSPHRSKTDSLPSGLPPGKVKAPKLRPVSAPTEPPAEADPPANADEQKTDNQVIAPDGEPETKQEPAPLF